MGSRTGGAGNNGGTPGSGRRTQIAAVTGGADGNPAGGGSNSEDNRVQVAVTVGGAGEKASAGEGGDIEQIGSSVDVQISGGHLLAVSINEDINLGGLFAGNKNPVTGGGKRVDGAVGHGSEFFENLLLLNQAEADINTQEHKHGQKGSTEKFLSSGCEDHKSHFQFKYVPGVIARGSYIPVNLLKSKISI